MGCETQCRVQLVTLADNRQVKALPASCGLKGLVPCSGGGTASAIVVTPHPSGPGPPLLLNKHLPYNHFQVPQQVQASLLHSAAHLFWYGHAVRCVMV